MVKRAGARSAPKQCSATWCVLVVAGAAVMVLLVAVAAAVVRCGDSPRGGEDGESRTTSVPHFCTQQKDVTRPAPSDSP